MTQPINPPEFIERAILVHLISQDPHDKDDLIEFKELVLSAGVEPLSTITGAYKKPNSRYFIGTGKVEEVKESIALLAPTVILFNHELKPSQERNLEKEFNCRVLDRTGLILDIFAQRAQTFEGRLQVELAQLQYLSTRLVRGWTHLERQRGGIGLRGPGETQLETDRRLLNNRIKAIKRQLDKVRSQREQGRQARKRANLPIVSLVGYTNAGKSTLFNQLTEADIFTANQLFATLDPTLRRIEIPAIGSIIVADTVGFIRKLPHDLVDAFRATLEETKQADLLLHVIDAAHPNKQNLIDQVNLVLKEIGADNVPQLRVYNKVDLLSDKKPKLHYNQHREIDGVHLSALKNTGMDLLEKALIARLGDDKITLQLLLSNEQGKLRAELHRQHAVIEEALEKEGGWCVQLQMRQSDYQRLRKQFGGVLPEVEFKQPPRD